LMHDPRISTALHQLADLGDEPTVPRWSWAIVGLERIGRIRLPGPAIEALAVGGGGVVRVRSARLALVVRLERPGARVMVDGRGRMSVAVWLRHAVAGSRMLLVGAQAERGLVVVAAVGVLDGIGDLLAGGVR
jgi:hypothetical protein